MRFAGIIYLHSLTDARMYNSSLQSLRMFRKLCGDDRGRLQNVILATTKWSLTPRAAAKRRERELCSQREFWGLMIQYGSIVKRFEDTRESAEGLVAEALHIGQRTFMPKLQQEVVEGKELAETDAGVYLQRKLKELKRQHEEEKQALLHEIDRARRERKF